MITITREELEDFIMAQSPDRPVNMDEYTSNYECGCVMVHYGKELLGFDDFKCMSYGFYSKINNKELAFLTTGIGTIINTPWKDIKNYGDIQKYLKTKVK